MKIGFSLGRCIRDIVNGDIAIDDVAFVISATLIDTREQIDDVIRVYMNEPRYLLDLDYDKCIETAYLLWDTNRLLQPRKEGMRRHMQPENSIWVDMFPTCHSKNDSVKKAWDGYRFMLHMVENVDMEATEVFKT